MDICTAHGKLILDGTTFYLKGASYFGLESDIRVPHGLWGGNDSTNIAAIATFLRQNKFNVVRLPLAADAIDANASIDTNKIGNEKELLEKFHGRELKYLDMIDHTVKVFGQHHVLVLLDMHVLHTGGPISELWYDPADPDLVQRAWKTLATRFSTAWNVIGADVMNEPHGAATWGTNDKATDWRLAATRLASTIHAVCPRWLIFVEGIQNPQHAQPPSFWGENISDAQEHPIHLQVSNKLVYSPHVYGPSVSHQPYFDSSDYPMNLPNIWHEHFGVLAGDTPIVIGEWGGSYNSPPDQQWQEAFAEYLEKSQIGSIYWCVNPNSGDTQGLLQDDWQTPRIDKLAVLDRFKSTNIAP